MKPFTGGAVITKPAGLEESLDFEIFDKTSGSEALRPWTSGRLIFVIVRA